MLHPRTNLRKWFTNLLGDEVVVGEDRTGWCGVGAADAEAAGVAVYIVLCLGGGAADRGYDDVWFAGELLTERHAGEAAWCGVVAGADVDRARSVGTTDSGGAARAKY